MRRAAGIAVRRWAALGLTAFGAVPAFASALDREAASQDEIMAGVRSCLASVGPSGLDEAHLAADGWSKGAMSNHGKPVATGLIFYGKGALMLMSSKVAPGRMQLCTITARIASVQSFPTIQAAMATAYGKPFKDDGKGEQMFEAPDHHFLDLASTGSNDRPSVRIAVGYVSQETK